MSEAKIEIKGTEIKLPLVSKDFSTGSKGFHGQGKLEISEKERYQINVIVVLIGSKPKKEKEGE